MIPISAITEWREYAPWGSSAQVEHALLPENMSYEYDVEWIYQYLFNEVVHRLPGEPWKGLDK